MPPVPIGYDNVRWIPPHPRPNGDPAPAPDLEPSNDDNQLRYYMPLEDNATRFVQPGYGVPAIMLTLGAMGRSIPVGYLASILRDVTASTWRNRLPWWRVMAINIVERNVPFFETRAAWTWKLSVNKLPRAATTAVRWCVNALRGWRAISTPLMVLGAAVGLYTLWINWNQPAAFDAPAGIYPAGGPWVEITQEQAARTATAVSCPAPLARAVQERVLLCERDPVLMNKVKTIATRWCTEQGLTDNVRYNAVAGALAAAMVVPTQEQNILAMGNATATVRQHKRIKDYIAGHIATAPWYSRLLLFRR